MASSAVRLPICSLDRFMEPTTNRTVTRTCFLGASCSHVPLMAFLRRLPSGVERTRITTFRGPSGQPPSGWAAAGVTPAAREGLVGGSFQLLGPLRVCSEEEKEGKAVEEEREVAAEACGMRRRGGYGESGKLAGETRRGGLGCWQPTHRSRRPAQSSV